MKKLLKWTLTLAMIAVFVFVMAGCNSKPVDGITIKTTPQMSVVLGQSLDLERGELEVTDGGEKYVVKMSDEGVEISGLDTSKIGEYEVKVTYKGQSATFTVKVVDRVSIRDYVADYFVGESFDNSEGRVEITRDNGTSYTKFLNDSKVTIEGFDTSKPAVGMEVTATYNDGTNEYKGKLIVNVYEIEDIQLNAPTKVSYYNHDKGLDLKGGELKLSGNGGKIKRDIPLTEDMVEGFNLGAATKENKETPLEQKLKVTYQSVSREFTIKITYTDVAEILQIAESMSNLDWAGESVPAYTKEQGEAALRAMQMYYAMPAAQRSAVPKAQRTLLADTAMAYGTKAWFADVKNYSDVLQYTVDGLEFTCVTYQRTVNGIELLRDTTRRIHVIGAVIGDIMDDYSDAPMGKNLLKCVLDPYISVIEGTESNLTDEELAQYLEAGVTYLHCPVLTQEDLNEELIPTLEYMIDLYEAVADVPTSWTNANVIQYATQINAAYELIVNSDYVAVEHAEIYQSVSEWRGDGRYEYMELLYTYLYENGQDTEKMNELAKIALPYELDALYQGMNEAIMQIDELTNGENNDASEFFYWYYVCREQMDNLANGIYGQMYVFLYENVSIDAILGEEQGTGYSFEYLMDLLKTTNYGFNYLLDAYCGDAEVEGLMEAYIDLIIADVDLSLDPAIRGAMVEDLFSRFVSMSASKQLTFLAALNPMFEQGVPDQAFKEESYFDYYYAQLSGSITLEDLEQMGYNSLDELVEYLLGQSNIGKNDTFYYSVFSEYINEHYKEQLGAVDVKGYRAFQSMLCAIESYALGLTYPEKIPTFVDALQAVTDVYDSLSDATKSVIGTAYYKYMAIAQYGKEDFTPTDLGEWADEFAMLKTAFDDAQLLYGLYYSGQISNIGLMISFERIEALVETIMTAPQEIIDAYRYEYLYEVDMGDGTVELLTYESVYATIRAAYISEITRLGGSYDMSADYTSSLKAYLNGAYDGVVVWIHTDPIDKPVEGDEDYESKLVLYNAYMEKRTAIGEAMIDSLLAFMDLSMDDKTTFYVLDTVSVGSGVSFYQFSVLTYGQEVLGSEANDLISLMTGDLLLYYTTYAGETDEDGKAEMKAKLEETLAAVKAAYEALADKAAFDELFGEVYELYVSKCEEALNA